MKPETIICAWCVKAFTWTPPAPKAERPRYCRKGHKDAARRASRRFASWFPEGTCPTPQKRAFDTAAQADRWLREFPERSGLNRAYRCNCGRFHIGRVRRHVHAK